MTQELRSGTLLRPCGSGLTTGALGAQEERRTNHETFPIKESHLVGRRSRTRRSGHFRLRSHYSLDEQALWSGRAEYSRPEHEKRT